MTATLSWARYLSSHLTRLSIGGAVGGQTWRVKRPGTPAGEHRGDA